MGVGVVLEQGELQRCGDEDQGLLLLRLAAQVWVIGAQDVAVRALEGWRLGGKEGVGGGGVQVQQCRKRARWMTYAVLGRLGDAMRMVECCQVDLAAATCDDGGGGN